MALTSFRTAVVAKKNRSESLRLAAHFCIVWLKTGTLTEAPYLSEFLKMMHLQRLLLHCLRGSILCASNKWIKFQHIIDTCHDIHHWGAIFFSSPNVEEGMRFAHRARSQVLRGFLSPLTTPQSNSTICTLIARKMIIQCVNPTTIAWTASDFISTTPLFRHVKFGWQPAYILIWSFVSFALGFISVIYIGHQNQYKLGQSQSSKKAQTTHTHTKGRNPEQFHVNWQHKYPNVV